MTTIKIEKLLIVFNALQAMAGMRLPVKASYRIAKNTRLAREEVDAYHAERLKLATELSGGKKTEDGSNFAFEPEARQEFDAKMNEVLAEEVEIAFVKLTPEDLGGAAIEPWILENLDGVIFEELQAQPA
tara:strand:+ start:4547 stop:4936 length:390 start_codon:yes stop_codon:yes gene_type:complete